MGDDDLLTSYYSPSWPLLRFWRWKLGLWFLVNQWEIHGANYFPYRVRPRKEKSRK